MMMANVSVTRFHYRRQPTYIFTCGSPLQQDYHSPLLKKCKQAQTNNNNNNNKQQQQQQQATTATTATTTASNNNNNSSNKQQQKNKKQKNKKKLTLTSQFLQTSTNFIPSVLKKMFELVSFHLCSSKHRY
jgi:DNA mismatch repair ATPase MutL